MSLLLILSLFGQAIFDEMRPIGNSVVLQIHTSTNSIYVLEASDRVSTGWEEQRLLAGTGGTIELTNETSGSSQFFRARILPRVVVSKPGTAVSVSFGLSYSAAQWTIEGELPDGMNFNGGTFSGIPTAGAAEKYSTGDYTNIVRFAGTSPSQAEIVHHVKLSFAQNIFPPRPTGPSLGTTCLACHGAGFPPDFKSSPSPLINVKAGSGGLCLDTWNYIVPGDLSKSLIYQKLVAPPCGEQMPYGGPFLSQTQLDRLARWIMELAPGELD